MQVLAIIYKEDACHPLENTCNKKLTGLVNPYTAVTFQCTHLTGICLLLQPTYFTELYEIKVNGFSFGTSSGLHNAVVWKQSSLLGR